MNTEESTLNELFGSGFGSDTGLLNKLPQLCAENTTTAELVEALDLLPHIARCIRKRISARNLIAAAPKCPLIPTETPEEAEELDRIERAHPTVIHPLIDGLLNSVRPM